MRAKGYDRRQHTHLAAVELLPDVLQSPFQSPSLYRLFVVVQTAGGRRRARKTNAEQDNGLQWRHELGERVNQVEGGETEATPPLRTCVRWYASGVGGHGARPDETAAGGGGGSTVGICTRAQLGLVFGTSGRSLSMALRWTE